MGIGEGPELRLRFFLHTGPGGSTQHPGIPANPYSSFWGFRGRVWPPSEAGAGDTERVAEAAGGWLGWVSVVVGSTESIQVVPPSRKVLVPSAHVTA